MTYEVMGFATQEGSDVNTDPLVQGQASKPPLVVIYSTEDIAEVDKILEAGGFVDESGVWFVAEGYREAGEFDPNVSTDSSVVKKNAEAIMAEEPGTFKRLADGPPPQNSTAEVTADGRVRGDRYKEPLTPEDVSKIAESEAEIPKKRNIIDPKGRL